MKKRAESNLDRAKWRPKPFSVGPVRVRIQSGPRDGEPDTYYWRAEVHSQGLSRTIWSGWATATHAAEIVAGVYATQAKAITPLGGATTPAEPAARTGIVAPVDTLGRLLRQWLAHQEDRHIVGDISIFTFRSDRGRSRAIYQRIGDLPLTSVTRASLDDYRLRRLREGAATSTLRLELCLLGAAWRWGHERGLTPDRILTLPTVKVTPKRSRYTPTTEEVERVLHELESYRDAYLATLLLYASGARPGEVGSLTWDRLQRIEATTDTGIVPAYRVTWVGKMGERVGWLLSPRAVRVLDDVPIEERQGRLLRWSICTARHWYIKVLRAACERAGVPPWTPYGLRRKAVDQLYATSDPAIAGRLLGHSPAVAIRHYRQPRDADLASAQLAAALGGASEVKQAAGAEGQTPRAPARILRFERPKR